MPADLHIPICYGHAPRYAPPSSWRLGRGGLAHHPDQAFASYIVNGISEGFRVGFDRSRATTCSPSLSNMPTTHPHLVSEYIQREVALERMSVVPLETSHTSGRLQISPIGIIPKKNKPNKWRLIQEQA